MCAQQLLTGRHPNLDTSKFFVEDLVARRFAAHCPYAYYCKDVTYHYAVGVLTLRGRVPTTALRQAIESLLTGVLGVEYIENEIDVINANGLSVVRPK